MVFCIKSYSFRKESALESLSVFGVISFCLSAYAYYPYYKEIIRGEAHPTISTWICWAMIDSSLLVGMLAKHALAIQVIAYILGCMLVLYACIKVRAPLGWWWLDTLCVGLVAGALLGWTLTGEADVGIAITGAAFFISTIPMLANMYREPEREPLWPWVISFLGACFGVMAIPAWTIADALTPAIFFMLGLVVVLLIGRKFRPSHNKLASQILMQD